MPSFWVQPSLMARAPCPSGTSPIASYSISSAMVKQSWVSTSERSPSATPASASARCQASRAALELEDVALGHRQEILHVLGGAERHRLAQLERGLDVGEHHRGGAVGHQRAVGALERAGDERVLLALGAAEVVAEILAHLRVGIADAVLVVLGRDQRERVGLVAPALEIERRRSCRKCRRSRRRYRPPRARRMLSAGCGRSPGRASSSSARRRPPARCARASPRSP